MVRQIRPSSYHRDADRSVAVSSTGSPHRPAPPRAAKASRHPAAASRHRSRRWRSAVLRRSRDATIERRLVHRLPPRLLLDPGPGVRRAQHARSPARGHSSTGSVLPRAQLAMDTRIGSYRLGWRRRPLHRISDRGRLKWSWDQDARQVSRRSSSALRAFGACLARRRYPRTPRRARAEQGLAPAA